MGIPSHHRFELDSIQLFLLCRFYFVVRFHTTSKSCKCSWSTNIGSDESIIHLIFNFDLRECIMELIPILPCKFKIIEIYQSIFVYSKKKHANPMSDSANICNGSSLVSVFAIPTIPPSPATHIDCYIGKVDLLMNSYSRSPLPSTTANYPCTTSTNSPPPSFITQL